MAAYEMPTELPIRIVDMRKKFADKPESVGKSSGRYVKVGNVYAPNPSFREEDE